MVKQVLQNVIAIRNTEEYQSLVEECQAIIVEGVFRSRQELIDTYKQLGERITTDNLYKKHTKISQGNFISQLILDIGKGKSTIYYAIQFVEKLMLDKELSTTVESDKNISWTKIKALLPPPKENTIDRIPPPKGKYELIVIDPPWGYGTEYNADTRRVASPYEELSQKELSRIVIPSAKDCVLWLWTTHRFIWDAKELMDKWGFEYKICLVWNKEKMGMGAWLRCQAEFCLLGIKGKPEWNLTNERDIISFSRKEHSRKPIEFYKMVEKLTPVETKLDMFGREKRSGWTIWGDNPEL